MSLNRVSYLESWEQNPASFRRQPYHDQSPGPDTDDDEYHDLPDTSLSSSFPSTASFPTWRNRLNFNPYAGPSWTQTTADGANPDLNSLPRAPSFVSKHGQVGQPAGEESAPQEAVLNQQDWSPLETTGAFEVGPVTRILQVCVAVIYCFFASGIIFGFAAIKPVFIKEGVYREMCSEEELRTNQDVCYGQELRLNLMFTIAAVATNVSALPVGTILDTYGPRVCGIIGSTCILLGAALFGLAARLPFDAYMPGYLLLALGGPFIFISSFHLSNTFPTRSGLILSCLSGAFDASSALFLVLRLINENTDGSFTSQNFFSIYIIIPLLIITVQVSIMPGNSYKTAGELVQQAEAEIVAEAIDQVDERIQDRNEGERQRNDRRMHRQSVVSKIQDLLTDGDDNASVITDLGLALNDGQIDTPGLTTNTATTRNRAPEPIPANTHTKGGVWGAMHGFSALQQVCSLWFILVTIFTVLQMLRINYFVASIRQQYEYLFSSPEDARHINEIFDFLLPIGGLLAVPFVGTILDNVSTPFVLLILAGTAAIIGVLGCIPHSYQAAYTNIVLFVVYRPFYYTAVSDYAAKVFGFQTFGKVYGLMICIAGLGNFAQAGLDALTFKVFDRNPIPVNIMMTGLICIAGATLVVFVWRRAAAMAAASGEDAFQRQANAHHDPEVAVVGRDWEREPLLQGGAIQAERQVEVPSYGTTNSA